MRPACLGSTVPPGANNPRRPTCVTSVLTPRLGKLTPAGSQLGMAGIARGTAEGSQTGDLDPLGLFPTIDQRLAVTFNYRVLFTEDIFAMDNPLLARTLASIQADTPSRFLCVVDNGLAGHRPGLIASIRAYASQYRELV